MAFDDATVRSGWSIDSKCFLIALAGWWDGGELRTPSPDWFNKGEVIDELIVLAPLLWFDAYRRVALWFKSVAGFRGWAKRSNLAQERLDVGAR